LKENPKFNPGEEVQFRFALYKPAQGKPLRRVSEKYRTVESEGGKLNNIAFVDVGDGLEL
jgi:hypothetical protein